MALRAKNKLTARKLLAGGFSKDGAQVCGIVRNTTGEGAEWQLYAIDVKTGAEKMLAPLDLPASADGVAGFSPHPDVAQRRADGGLRLRWTFASTPGVWFASSVV